jgi:hypothetical protein
MNPNESATHAFLPALYAVAALFLIAPVTDLLGLTWPVRVAEAGWRFGSIGLGFEKAFVQIIGLTLGMGLAAILGHRRVLRSLSALSLSAAFVVCAAMVRFILDFGDLRAFIPAVDLERFDANAYRATLYAILAVPVLVVLGGRAWMASARVDRKSFPDLDERVIPLYRRRRS